MTIKATSKGVKAIHLAIAELVGFKPGQTPLAKEQFGQECWLKTTLHDLDLSDEEDRKEVHENIWLTRLYGELDQYFQVPTLAGNIHKAKALQSKASLKRLTSNPNPSHSWVTPIEADASASMLQMIGVLLNDNRLCTMTNVLGDTLSDPWDFEGIPRTMFKHAATPRIYGSTRPCHELWKDKKHDFTLKQVKDFNEELATGALGLADTLKEFIVNHCNPQPTMTVHIFNEHINIECNRFKNVGEQTNHYDIFDTDSNAIRRIAHTTTKRVPDLEQFRRFMVTCLI